MSYTSFRRIVWAHYRAHGRHDLPWRKTRDPYRILVSEVMLQQTQVERVKPFYGAFLRQFPTARRLAAAPLSEVLKAWQGLGYNRRAKMLHQAGKEIAKAGMPGTAAELQRLPGVGPYTARAVAAFAYGEESVFIETNIRTAVMYHFFSHKRTVSDAEVEKVLAACLPKGKPREWNYALMDYGAFLKRSGVRLNSKRAQYAKPSAFPGSMREARGAILKELAKRAAGKRRLLGLLGDGRTAQMSSALSALCAEELIRTTRDGYALAR